MDPVRSVSTCDAQYIEVPLCAAQVKSLERLTQEQEEGLKTYQDRVTHLETEVGKHTQIASLIHSLSSGQTLPPGVLPVNK